MSDRPENEVKVTREEFEEFLHLFTHEIRNRLNGIALEAADLAEQAGPDSDASRLHQQIRDCSVFLKGVRDSLAPDDVEALKMALGDFIDKLKQRKS